MAYRIFVSDSLKAIAHNTGRAVPEGVQMSKRYYDVLTQKQVVETRTAEEVIDYMKQKIAGGE